MNGSNVRATRAMATMAACLLGLSVALAGCTCGNRFVVDGVCVENETRCAGDAVETCSNGDWVGPVSCMAGDSCSFGACSSVTDCGAECTTTGATFCSGGSVLTCGDFDADTCLDLGMAVACPAGQFCSNGSCSATCTDECSTGDVLCAGAAASRSCGNFDEDDCLDLGAPTACPAGQSCVAGSGGFGSCMPVTCTDECDPLLHQWTCAGVGFTACVTDGDADPCFEEATLACDVCSNPSPPVQCIECCG